MVGETILLGPGPEEEKDYGHDPFKVRPGRGFVLILVDPRKTTMSSGLYIPMETNHEKLHEGTGLVARINPVDAEKLKAIGFGENDRVLYRGYLRHANKLMADLPHSFYTDGTVMEWCFIAIADVVAVLEPGVEVGLLSEKK